MFSTVLIIDKRRELPIKYKKSIENNINNVVISPSIKDGLEKIQLLSPDMIIISDSIGEKLTSFCEKIRTLTCNTRPVIIAMSKSADVNDRIETLKSGADDFLSEPVNTDELKMRVNAHLRRDVELYLNDITMLPNKKYTHKIIKRYINMNKPHSLLLVQVNELESYKSVYSELAGNKILQTLVAIIKSSLNETDYLGHLSENELLIITNPYNAEKLAEFITFAFDTVVPKFYSQKDAEQGFMILKGNRQAERRANFVSVTVGVAEYNKLITSIDNFLQKLYEVKENAKIPYGSSYAIERICVTGKNSIANKTGNKKILIKEPDKALNLLLKTTIELQGYEVISNLSPKFIPDIIIMDSGDDLSELGYCKKIKSEKKYNNTKVIITTTVQDKISILNAGADLYLPKPYKISDVIQWIEYFLKD